MAGRFTLEYWMDDGWYVGRIKEVPGVFSQGKTLPELETAIRDAYKMIMEDDEKPCVRLIEDIEDLAIIAERKDEELVSFEEVKRRLSKHR